MSDQQSSRARQIISNGEKDEPIGKFHAGIDPREAGYLGKLVDGIPEALIATDLEFKITRWNRAAADLYGWSQTQALGQSLADLIPIEYVEGTRQDVFQKVKAESFWSGPVQQARKDGQILHVLSSVALLRDEDGNGLGWVIINRPITEQESVEEHFHMAVKAAPNAIVMVDQSGAIILVNPKAEEYFGYTQDELVGGNVDKLVPAQYTSTHARHRAKFIADPQMREMGVGRELHAVRKDGSEFPVEIGLAPVRTPAGLFVLATIVDITARKQAEEHFRLAVESAPNAILLVDESGTIILLNSMAEKYFGYPSSELIGKSMDRLVPQRFESKHPKHRANFFINPQSREMGTGRDLYALRKNGTEFPVEIGLAPIESHNQTLVLATIVDITDRKQAEEELRRLNRELDAFAHSVSHDLRVPLRGIDVSSTMLEQKYSAILDVQGRQYLSRIRANIQRMGRMIDDLLLLAKLTSHEVRRTRVNLAIVAQEILRELTSQEPGRQIHIEIDEHVEGWCDAGLIRNVLQNLLGNAWKFTSRRAQAWILFGYAPQSQPMHKVYVVRDNGVGFDMAYAVKLFSAFQRLHSDRDFPGHGIGLATVQRIIHRHGGRIWAEASPNEGAAFYFTLGD